MRAARVWGAFISVAAVAAGVLALLATSAFALEPGVHIDPGSPAAKEYALPVDQARGTGSGGKGEGEGSGGSSEKLFGAGIKPPSSGSTGGRHRGHRSPRVSGSTKQPTATPTQAATPRAVQQAAARSSSGGSTSLLVLFGGGVAILVLGAFTGVVLRHNRRPTSLS